MNIYTIGHSTRTLEELTQLLDTHQIQLLIDVRSYPSSKYCPQWNKAEIEKQLPSHIAYQHFPLLGGKRKALPKSESRNNAWRNQSFRGYADYMQTESFNTGLRQLMALGKQHRLAIMCSEAVWWRCHRSMISDALVALGINVYHIMENGLSKHQLRDFAVVKETITYPATNENIL